LSLGLATFAPPCGSARAVGLRCLPSGVRPSVGDWFRSLGFGTVPRLRLPSGTSPSGRLGFGPTRLRPCLGPAAFSEELVTFSRPGPCLVNSVGLVPRACDLCSALRLGSGRGPSVSALRGPSFRRGGGSAPLASGPFLGFAFLPGRALRVGSASDRLGSGLAGTPALPHPGLSPWMSHCRPWTNQASCCPSPLGHSHGFGSSDCPSAPDRLQTLRRVEPSVAMSFAVPLLGFHHPDT
jgi:hypothetical protein